MAATSFDLSAVQRNDQLGLNIVVLPYDCADEDGPRLPTRSVHSVDLVTERAAKARATATARVAAAVATSTGRPLGDRGAGDVDVVLHVSS